mmetsp:Transcript_25695/g.46414  ORF Transcript_25695/g.46414 Transcript_25695/m.46414 type:complete len:97 (-) Transcript_25695:50-340(-)
MRGCSTHFGGWFLAVEKVRDKGVIWTACGLLDIMQQQQALSSLMCSILGLDECTGISQGVAWPGKLGVVVPRGPLLGGALCNCTFRVVQGQPVMQE